MQTQENTKIIGLTPFKMKILFLILVLSCTFVGCIGGRSSAIDDNDFSRVKVGFKSSGETIDLLGISGLSMGPMYSSNSFTPKFVGNTKSAKYTSYHDVELAEELTIRWRLSFDHTKVFEQVMKRPESIPATVPREHIVIFQHSKGTWTIIMRPLP